MSSVVLTQKPGYRPRTSAEIVCVTQADTCSPAAVREIRKAGRAAALPLDPGRREMLLDDPGDFV